METKAARSAFWTFFLLLFPLTAHLSPARCVDYKQREICGLKGSSVEFSCTYPTGVPLISIPGWSRKWGHKSNPKPLAKWPSYLSRMKYPGNSRKDCTMRLKNLTDEDASLYYFTYKFRNVTGDHVTCNGVPGVRLHIVTSPVSILVEEIVGRQRVPITDCRVIEGKRIMLTCVPTCAADLSNNRGYIWYKNRVQITDSKVNLPYVSLDPVSMKDTGSYGCAMISYKDLPSSVVNLSVQAKPSPKTFRGKSLFVLLIMLASSVCVGWIITTIVSILVFKAKKRHSASSVPGTPNSDTYMDMDINSVSHEYDTLDTLRCSFTNETVYENLY